MPEANDLNVLEYATLVDRTGQPSEFVFDGRRYTFTGPTFRRTVPLYIAEWLFHNDRAMVWTTEGVRTCRYGIVDAPEELMATLGEAPFETDAITIDLTRVEGWDTDTVGDRGPMRTIQLRRNPADFAHQGGPAVPTISGKER